MADGLREILRVRGPIEAQLVRGLLEAYEMLVQLVAAPPSLSPTFALQDAREIRVLVREEDADAAHELLAAHRKAGLLVVTGADAP